ncbi:hypothetical protein H310_04700 [Aphanomyces invadans]|uniref:FYVE-type domain-containing protein n=1 Tax=Aphanomyces invadans TaxID=157072 RepID=A0A024UEZ1_9STRA|nr:hypothetical protein H310_04700 [Aphanomyces invadans]ETW04422.1 hypothetical protein H310_04700 [Aphanomyces invadans]|eukprot:XP_008867378.1 hypothetical protein H310_04700 [Aphanomyces invadans]
MMNITHPSFSGISAKGHMSATTSSSMSSSVPKFPLPDDYFATPNLTANEADFFNSVARKSCTKVIYYARPTGGPVTWIPIASSPHVQVFSGKQSGDSSTVAYFCAVTQLQASLDDVARVFRTETTAKYREHAKTFAPDYLDCATLTNLVLPSETTPLHYIGVKWAAVESPTIFIKPRDFCFLECQDEFVDRRTGRRGWVNSMHSVNWGQVCPPMDKSHGLVRGSIYRSGYVFIESSRPNCLEVVHVLQVDMKGSVPAWVMSSIMKRRVMEVGRLQHFFRVKTLDPTSFLLSSTQSKAKKSRGLLCHVCRTTVLSFSQRHHCRKCGHVVCKKCSADLVVDLPDVGLNKLRVCAECTSSNPGSLKDRSVDASATADEFWDYEPRAFKTDRGQSQASTPSKKQGRFQSSDWFLSHRTALMANPFRPSVSLSCDAANSALVSDIADASVEVQEELMPGTSKFPDHFVPRTSSRVRASGPSAQRTDTAALKRMRQTRGNHKLGESFGIEHFNPDDITFHSLDRPSSIILAGNSSMRRTASAIGRDEWTFNSLIAVRSSQHGGASHASSSRMSDVSDLSIDEDDDSNFYNDGDNNHGYAPMQVLTEDEFESSVVGMDNDVQAADQAPQAPPPSPANDQPHIVPVVPAVPPQPVATHHVATANATPIASSKTPGSTSAEDDNTWHATSSSRRRAKLLTPQPHPSQLGNSSRQNQLSTPRQAKQPHSLVSESFARPSVYDRPLPPTPQGPTRTRLPSSHGHRRPSSAYGSEVSQSSSGPRREATRDVSPPNGGTKTSAMTPNIEDFEKDKLDALAAQLAERLMRADSVDKDTIRSTLVEVLKAQPRQGAAA